MTSNGPAVRTTDPTEQAGTQGVPQTIIAEDITVLYEDEGQEEMGDTRPHARCIRIITIGLEAHFKHSPHRGVLDDMNLYYHRVDKWAYVSPDIMVVETEEPLPDDLTSYRIGMTGPSPLVAIEVLSRRSFQQQDLTTKPILYSELGVREYILLDVTGDFLPQRLWLKTLQADGTWINQQDPDGGVTSQLGFRIVIEADDLPRVLDAASGKRYLRPQEAQAAADAMQQRIRELEAELARLRGSQIPPEGGVSP